MQNVVGVEGGAEFAKLYQENGIGKMNYIKFGEKLGRGERENTSGRGSNRTIEKNSSL